MPNLLLVILGGAIGAGFRYHIGRVALEQMGPGFPWGTLIVNLLGGLLVGVLAGIVAANHPADRPLWMFLGVGVLGGFTTFSAFSFDIFAMIERNELAVAAAYAVASVAGSVVLLFLGFWFARATA
ncbi:MAG TPA: fluoride efflux transporter CrcB [Allosphingosinicella sp.]|nr:fluoride efflux transporter CrcB [Allosphingosinicella sp.]